MTDATTPSLADAGDISPPIERATPATERPSFAQQREAQDRAAADKAAPPAADPKAPTSAGDKVKVGDMEVSQAELQEYMQSKAAAELKKASLPASPADYKAELPADFQMPAGITDFKFDTTDPLFISAQAWAHARQIDQGTFSEMVGLYASAKATEAAQLAAAHADQVAKMGINGVQRVSALETWLRGVIGDDRIAGQMRAMMATADIVKGMERIQARMVSQGSASFSQSGRVAPETNTIPNYEGMTFAQRRQAQDELARR